MQASQIPTKMPVVWASGAGSSYIRTIPVTTVDPDAASYTLGYPPNTMTAEGAGGVPPDGRDTNGILNPVTAWLQWLQAGGPVAYDSTFQTSIGGYPQGARVASATTSDRFWLSTVDNNLTNPDTGGAGWTQWPTATLVGTGVGVSGSAPGGSKTASWSVPQVTAASSLGGVSYYGSALSLSFNGATVGAGGMDTGATPTAGDLAIYLIYNPTTSTWATLGTVASFGQIYSGANLPSGYTASCLLWVGKTDNLGNIITFQQRDRKVGISPATASPTASAGYVPLSLVGIVPAVAVSVSGNFTCGTVNSTSTAAAVASTSSGIGQQLGGQSSTYIANTYNALNFVDLPMVVSQTIYTNTYSASSPTPTMAISGYSF